MEVRLERIQEYESFGSLLPGRNYSSNSYNFGFQGQIKDDQIYGATGTSYAFEYRFDDVRLGRFLSIDPLAAKYPQWSPYVFSGNQVITSRELEGLEPSKDLNFPKAETKTQMATRKAYTAAADLGNIAFAGQLAQDASDEDVTAYQLFHEWVYGAGPDSRQFDENSTMGVQMLNAPEVLKAMQTAATNAVNDDDCEPVNLRRQLSKENPIHYIANDLPRDILGRNPARGFHGSFTGVVTATDVVDQGERGVLVNLTVTITDRMTAELGTRASGTVGGYDKKHPTAVYTQENPYGPIGPFRTIDVQYIMHITVLLPPVKH